MRNIAHQKIEFDPPDSDYAEQWIKALEQRKVIIEIVDEIIENHYDVHKGTDQCSPVKFANK